MLEAAAAPLKMETGVERRFIEVFSYINIVVVVLLVVVLVVLE